MPVGLFMGLLVFLMTTSISIIGRNWFLIIPAFIIFAIFFFASMKIDGWKVENWRIKWLK